MAFYPEQASLSFLQYQIPFGKSVETDSRGFSTYYEYDAWGRLTAVFDHDRYVIKKYDYQVKP